MNKILVLFKSFVLRHWRWLAAAFLCLLVIGIASITLNEHSATKSNTSIDLIKGHDWNDYAGASQTANGVQITPLDRKIVNQDGSGGQPNPPVNLAGPKVVNKSDLTITARLKSCDSGDSLQLYAAPPIIYDEWRYESPSIRYTCLSKAIKISLWDGTSASPISETQFPINGSELNWLQLKLHGDKILIKANGQQVADVVDQDIFRSQHIYFGTDATNGWTLASLTAQGNATVNDSIKSISTYKRSGLKAASKRLNIGTAVSLNPLLTDQKYQEIALSQFGIWTTENELKPQFIHPAPNVYSFKDADTLINIATRHGIAVHGHTLVFGEANPRWMQDAPLTQRQQIMTDHITAVMKRYKGRVKEWDVINEPLSDNHSDYQNGDGLRRHIWYQAMGSSYIATALKTAHAADPNAKLYINDYGLETDGDRWDTMLQLVTDLKQRGVPLDGIGFESHIYEDGDEVDPAVLKQHIEELAKLGLKSRISEIDVHGEDQTYQAQQYSAVLTACLQETSCTAYSTWGITDRYGSTTDIGTYPLDYGNDLLWTSNYKTKPAYSAILKILRG